MNLTRTIYGAGVQTALMLGTSHRVHENSTINEALNMATVVPFQPTVATRGMQIARPYDPAIDTRSLKMAVVVIGNRGHITTVEPDEATTFTAKERDARSSGLSGIIPFIVRRIDNDLSINDRKKYRLRKTLEIGGELYAAYYGRVFDLSNLSLEYIISTINSGIKNTTTLTPTAADLKPTGTAITGSTEGSYARVSAISPLSFTAEEIYELKNACNILWNKENLAMISEIGFCTAVDKPVYRTYPNSGDQQYVEVPNSPIMESVACQPAIVLNIEPITAGSLNSGMSITTDVGISEPLFSKKIGQST